LPFAFWWRTKLTSPRIKPRNVFFFFLDFAKKIFGFPKQNRKIENKLKEDY